MDELKRILANVQYMVSEGAPEADLEAYLKTEGYTLQSLNDAVGKAEQRQAAEARVAASGNPVTDFLTMAVAGNLSGFRGQDPARDAAVQQRVADLRLLNPGPFGAASLASAAPLAAAGGVGALGGLGAAGRAIQAARMGAPRATGLLDALGRPIMAPTTRSATATALRALAQNPVLRTMGRGARKAIPYGLGAGTAEALRWLRGGG